MVGTAGLLEKVFNAELENPTAYHLAKLGLDFIGFEQFEENGINDAYREAYPDDETLTDLDNWDAFEAGHEGFIDMYLLWCRKPE